MKIKIKQESKTKIKLIATLIRDNKSVIKIRVDRTQKESQQLIDQFCIPKKGSNVFNVFSIQIIKGSFSMIRRTTPNKSFIEDKRQSSCCSWSEHEQAKNQLRIKLPQKTLPIRFSNNTSRCSSKEELKEQNVYETPTKVSQQVWKSSGNSNQIIWRTARATTDRKPQPLITLPSSEAAKNPLERLQKMHKTNKKVGEKFNVSTPTSKPVLFSYLTPRKQVNIKEELSTAVATVVKSEQHQGWEENTLCREIQTFRREYQQLLKDYNLLKTKKQTNISIYRELLEKIEIKKEEIAALQKLRREEIEGLRQQIEVVIAEREHALGEQVYDG